MSDSAPAPRSETAAVIRVPPPYEPAMLQAGGLRRFCWGITSLGRFRKRLWAAHREPGNSACREALAVALARMEANSARSGPEHAELARTALLFLAWSAIEQNSPAEATRWLADLDRRFADSAERLSLRWRLLERLKQTRSLEAYASQAKLFLADAQGVAFETSILNIVQTVHEEFSPAGRVEFTATFHPLLAGDSRVAATLVLWQCPSAFGSQSEAREWGQRLAPDALRFAPRMQADALVATGRIAEWEKDWATMQARGADALHAFPQHPGARLLEARALLQQGQSGLADQLKTVAIPESPERRRLILECQLHDRMDLQSVRALLAVLPEVMAANDGLELDLVLRLCERALTSSFAREPAQLVECAELTTQLAKHAGDLLAKLPFFRCDCVRCHAPLELPRELADQTITCPRCKKPTKLAIPGSPVALLPWAEVNVALKEMQCDRRYGEAVQRLEQADLQGAAEARSFARVARLLAGSPKTGADPVHDHPSLAALALALDAVLGAPSEQAVNWCELRAQVAEALHDPLLAQFPALAAAGQVLMLAVRLLGDDPAVGEELAGCDPRLAAPPWAVWLLGRLQEMQGRYAEAADTLGRVPLRDLADAWFVEAWWYNSTTVNEAEPPAVAEARRRLDEQLPTSSRGSGDPLRLARLQNYQGAAPPSAWLPPAESFRELGELGSQHCRLEAGLELRLADACHSLAIEDHGAAVGKLRKLLQDAGQISPLVSRWWRPFIERRLGLALARAGQPEAQAILAEFLEGPRAPCVAPTVRAEALVALGRLAEWNRDWTAMEDRARKALRAVAGYPDGVALLARACLRRARVPLPGELATVTPPNTSSWGRLKLQADLRVGGDLGAGRALIASLADPARPADPLDLELSIQLLEEALTSQGIRSSDRLQEVADLSTQLGHLAGSLCDRLPFFKHNCAHCGGTFEFSRQSADRTCPCPHCGRSVKPRVPRNAAEWLPWTEINVALKEIHLDRRYSKAFQRLEQAEMAACLPARPLALVARLLAGSPQSVSEPSGVHPCLTVLAKAIHRILGRTGSEASNWDELQPLLAQALQEAFLQDFPALIAGAEVLLLAVRVLKEDPNVREELLRYEVSQVAPLWATWLLGRLIELVCRPEEAAEMLSRVPLKGIADAWFLEAWWHNYGWVDGPEPSVVAEARRLLDEQLPPFSGSAGDPLRVVRRHHYRAGQPPASWSAPGRAFAELGESAGRLCAAEIQFELILAQARWGLQHQQVDQAAAKLRTLRAGLGEGGPCAARWWQPVVDYWLGVAQAHAGKAEAVETLSELLSGPKAAEARTQLALLAMRENDPAAAQWWLGDLETDLPAACYLRALLLARQGQLAEASLRLNDLVARFGRTGSPYPVAALRLQAALAARAGRIEEAVESHENFLRAHPGDAIAATRLAYLRLRQNYASASTDLAGPWLEIAGLVQADQSVDPVIRERAERHRLLAHVLGCADVDLEAVRAETKDLCSELGAGLAWRQLLAWRLLRAARPEDALAVSRGGTAAQGSSRPTWSRRGAAVLKAWSTLKRAGELARDGFHGDELVVLSRELAACLEDCRQLASGADGASVGLWTDLLNLGMSMASQESSTVPCLRQAPAAWPFAHVPDLWAEEAAARVRAAEHLERFLEGAVLNGARLQQRLLGCLASLALGRDDQFLGHYSSLEADLASLPVQASQLWQAAARLWLARRDWKRLLVDDLPTCLADLSDPGVRFIIGLAYARSAAEDASRGDARAAVQKVRKARSTLEPLLASTSEEPDGRRA